MNFELVFNRQLPEENFKRKENCIQVDSENWIQTDELRTRLQTTTPRREFRKKRELNSMDSREMNPDLGIVNSSSGDNSPKRISKEKRTGFSGFKEDESGP